MVITGGIALFSVGMIFYKFHENKESEIYTNKPYKQYYTVYRYTSSLSSCDTNLIGCQA